MINITENQLKAIKRLVGNTTRKPARIGEYRINMSLASYWDSGSIDYYHFIRLVGDSAQLLKTIPSNGSAFDRVSLTTTEQLQENTILVENSIFCGKQIPLKIYC